jgi:hypothetical protein
MNYAVISFQRGGVRVVLDLFCRAVNLPACGEDSLHGNQVGEY